MTDGRLLNAEILNDEKTSKQIQTSSKIEKKKGDKKNVMGRQKDLKNSRDYSRDYCYKKYKDSRGYIYIFLILITNRSPVIFVRDNDIRNTIAPSKETVKDTRGYNFNET